MRLRLATMVVLVLGVFAAACSTTGSPEASGSSSSTTGAGASSGGTTTSAGCTGVSRSSVQWSPAGTFGTKPTVTVPTGPPPNQLLSQDLIVGTGATAQAGSTVTVQYVGVSYCTKQQFDASWDRGQPYSFQLGVHQVIQGWDQGVVGMKVGGRRELVIPPQLAYGSTSPGAGIAPNDTLIFVVDLLQVS